MKLSDIFCDFQNLEVYIHWEETFEHYFRIIWTLSCFDYMQSNIFLFNIQY